MDEVEQQAPRVVDVDGLAIRVQVSGAGRPLLLVNGIGANIEMWEPLVRRLRGFEVIAFDMPGTGGSATPRCPMSIKRLARLATHLLERLGYDDVDALGVSFGGAVVQEMCRRRLPIRRAVLAATSFGWGSVPGRLGAMAALATPLRYYSPRYYDLVAGQLLGGEARRSGLFMDAHRTARFAQPPTARGYAWQMTAGATWTSWPWLHQVHQPTLVLAGDDDPIIRVVNARLLAALLPNARLEVIAGGGHLFVLERAVEIAPRLEDFLLRQLAAAIHDGTARPTTVVGR